MTCEPRLVASCERWPPDVDLWHLAIPLTRAEQMRALGGVDGVATAAPETSTGIVNDLDAVGDVHTDARAMAVLDPSERLRASRYRQSADRRRFIRTRAALRALLSERLQVPAEAIPLQATARGRLFVPGQDALSFNVSHAGEHALIAISNARTVGVDIERIDSAMDWEALSASVCTPAEATALHRRPLHDRHAGFFRCWTAKEAVLKALGLGITEGLQALSIDLDAVSAQQPVVDIDKLPALAPAKDLRFTWLDDIPGYVGCIACNSDDA